MAKVANSSSVPGQELTEEGKITLGLLGVVIADHPERIRKLLREFGIDTSNNPTGRELTNKVIYGIDTRGSEFHLELAKVLSAKLPKEDGYDSYEGEDYGDEDYGEQEDSYVNLIMGAIAGIGSAVGNIKSKRQRRAEASQKTMSTMMAYKAQQEQIVANRIAQEQAHANRMNLLKGIGIIVGVVVVGFIVYKKSKSPAQPQTALT